MLINEEIITQLNPKLFENNELKPQVREKLLEIADEFLSHVDDELIVDVLDIRMVGSQAGYNYTNNSDIDLHLVVDLSKICREVPELVQFLFNAEKSRFNLLYDISVKGIPVEVYVEDVRAGTHSNGIYSVLYDQWVKVPHQTNVDYDVIYDKVKISQEYRDIVSEINQAVSSGDSEQISRTLSDLYLMRKSSLDANGELGRGNLLFKLLRNEGYLDKLRKAYYETRSNELTLEQMEV